MMGVEVVFAMIFVVALGLAIGLGSRLVPLYGRMYRVAINHERLDERRIMVAKVRCMARSVEPEGASLLHDVADVLEGDPTVSGEML